MNTRYLIIITALRIPYIIIPKEICFSVNCAHCTAVFLYFSKKWKIDIEFCIHLWYTIYTARWKWA